MLWFEHDLYDQSALARSWPASPCARRYRRSSSIAIDRFPGVERFLGLGQLSPAQLASLWPRRKAVTKRQLGAGSKVWAALCAATPEPLMEIVADGMADLPLMKAALQRQLQELPWTTDGLSLTEREALRALAKGPLAASEVFAIAQQKREPQPFMGDLFFFAVLRDLLELAAAAARGHAGNAARGVAAPRAAPHAGWPRRARRQARLANPVSARTLGRRHRDLPSRPALALESADQARTARHGLKSPRAGLIFEVALWGRPCRVRGIGRDGPGLQRGDSPWRGSFFLSPVCARSAGRSD